MKYSDFIKIYRDVPIIDSSTFSLYVEKPQNLRRQVREWVKKGYLVSLKKGLYIFSEEWRKVNPSVLFVANFLVDPSYVSLEYALGFHGIIPEKVTVITSITTKKTNFFKNALGDFEYRSVKKDLFWGYKKEVDKDQEFFIARPEKALIDFFYLNSNFKGDFLEFESLRLQNLEEINTELLDRYSLKYNKRLKRLALALIAFTNKKRSGLKRL